MEHNGTLVRNIGAAKARTGSKEFPCELQVTVLPRGTVHLHATGVNKSLEFSLTGGNAAALSRALLIKCERRPLDACARAWDKAKAGLELDARLDLRSGLGESGDGFELKALLDSGGSYSLGFQRPLLMALHQALRDCAEQAAEKPVPTDTYED